MRFVSKSSRYKLVLEPALSAQPLSGFPGKKPVHVMFENGVVEIRDEGLIQRMLNHPACIHFGDYVAVKENEVDPFADRREEIEPMHVITEMKYGHADASSSSPIRKTKVNPALKQLVNDLATKQMQEMLPGLISEGVKKVLATMQAEANVVVPTPIGEDEEEEEDFSDLTVEDFLEESSEEGTDSVDTTTTVTENAPAVEEKTPAPAVKKPAAPAKKVDGRTTRFQKK